MLPASWAPWVCPSHREQLDQRPDALSCPRGERFPITAGVPRFVVSDDYAAAFGRQWNRFRRTQLDSHSRLPISRDRLRRILGDGLWRGLDGATVLEAGAGAGRFTEILLERGARVVSLDLSSAVEANAANFPPSERHAIAQADIRAMPLETASFDLVLVLGVVQHTPGPEAAIRELFTMVKPGGWLAFDHYTWAPSWLGIVWLYRHHYKRMTPDESMPRIERLVDRLLPLHRRAARNRALTRVLTQVSPVVSFYAAFPILTEDEQRDWALLDTYDSLTDTYKHLRSRRAIERTLRGLGAVEIECRRGGNGVEARAMRAHRR